MSLTSTPLNGAWARNIAFQNQAIFVARETRISCNDKPHNCIHPPTPHSNWHILTTKNRYFANRLHHTPHAGLKIIFQMTFKPGLLTLLLTQRQNLPFFMYQKSDKELFFVLKLAGGPPRQHPDYCITKLSLDARNGIETKLNCFLSLKNRANFFLEVLF